MDPSLQAGIDDAKVMTIISLGYIGVVSGRKPGGGGWKHLWPVFHTGFHTWFTCLFAHDKTFVDENKLEIIIAIIAMCDLLNLSHVYVRTHVYLFLYTCLDALLWVLLIQ